MENKMVSVTIDGLRAQVSEGTSILEAAKSVGIEIPNLCYLKELGAYGACGVCVVEVKNSPKLLRACSAKVSEGMEVFTKSERALKTRKLALDLLMGDHDGDCIGPCRLNCPAHTDCQKYVAQIAAGDFPGAVKTIRENVALPASIGRVCPHPCEKACRRHLVEEPIAIAQLKYFAADRVRLEGNALAEVKKQPSGKTVGIIGGGPAGLAAAYRLALAGHQVTIYDQMPALGGMLRYGIPEYRLPKDILQAEIDYIGALGVTFVPNFKVGRDGTLKELRGKHDAILVANGAWKSMPMRCCGEDAKGVFGGIDFLREIAMGGKPDIGLRTAIVGGGNTAMDACRSAIRLGAKEVSVIYRRTRTEMPAEDIEIQEATEEGVIFRFLVNPAEILTTDGRVSGVKLQVMELGEPDERGRRKPVPVEGKFETLSLDSIIVAVGQKNDAAGFEDLPQTQKGTIAADEHTFATSIPGIFAAGDTTNRGAGIAIAAMAEANEAASAIDDYLAGREISYVEPIVSERHPTEKDYAEYGKVARVKMPVRPAAERRADFKEVNLGLTVEAARGEAYRCLKCGCHDYGECKLIRYANEVKADVNRFRGAFHPGEVEEKLVSIARNQHKCILCNLCVRVCEQKAKQGLLGLVDRGFKTVIRPEFNTPEATAVCKDCHLCADNCPTGALQIIG